MTNIDTSTEAVEALILDSLKFSDLAGGEGLTIFGVSPEDFLFDYSKATGFEDWDNIGQHIIASLRAERDQLRDELEAKLAKAVESLRELSNPEWAVDEPSAGWCPDHAQEYVDELEVFCNWAVEKSKETFAELTGGNYE